MLKIVKYLQETHCQDYLCSEMSKRFIWTLAVFMALAMLGLILVQTYWINNAYQLKENQFSQLVNRALNNVSGELQEHETMWHIMNEVESVDTGWTGSQEVFSFQFEGSQLGNEFNMDINASVHRNGILDESVYIYERSNPTGGEHKITIIAEDTMVRFSDYPELQFDSSETGRITLIRPEQIRSRVRKDMTESRVFIDRIMQRMIAPMAPLEERISQESLKRIIDRQLANIGIELDYEYAVLRNNLEIAFQTENYNYNEESDNFVTSLFPQDIFSSSGYLSLYFPRKTSFLFRSLGFMGISSMILTLVIILSFSITIFIIFRQKRLSEIKNDFVSNMTHELKTPISTISLASQMLNDSSIPDQAKNLDNITRIITDESKRLGYQVEKVLQMAIFDRGRIRLKKKKTDIHDLVHSVVSNFALQIESKNGRISEAYEADRSAAMVDTVHFTNLVSNLIDNAIKYSGENPRIVIKTYNKNNKLFISVEDNGVGIRKEDQRRVFEKFYRVPAGNIHNVKGFGLGLSYVKKIVEEHDGSVNLKSELNKGTEFVICIPINGN